MKRLVIAILLLTVAPIHSMHKPDEKTSENKKMQEIHLTSIALPVIPLLIFRKYHGHLPDQWRAAFILKGERRKQETKHSGLLTAYFQKECPRNDQYTMTQKIFSSAWVNECQALNEQLEVSKKILNSYDDQIKRLKNFRK